MLFHWGEDHMASHLMFFPVEMRFFQFDIAMEAMAHLVR
jgi:hypothetical protein